MGTIISIEAPRGRGRQVQVRLDSGQCLYLDSAVVAERGLTVGLAVSLQQAQSLLAAEQVRRGLEIAHRLLGYRPRSRAEIETRLRRAGVEESALVQVLQRLQEQDLLDDVAFARFWREERERVRPRGTRYLLWELDRLGVAPDVAREAVADLDEAASAYRVGQRLARTLSTADPGAFRQRLEAALRRRGFGGDAIRSALSRLREDVAAQ